MRAEFKSSKDAGRTGLGVTSKIRARRKAKFENLMFVFRDNNYESLEYGKCFVASKKIVWHYTTGEALLNIWDTEVLSPSRGHFGDDTKPVLWFSSDQDWEPVMQTVHSGANGQVLNLSKAEAGREHCGPVRLGLPSEVLRSWDDITRRAGFDETQIQVVRSLAREQGASPEGWMGCLERVSIWDLMIEVWDGESWECLQDPSTTESKLWTAIMKEAA